MKKGSLAFYFYSFVILTVIAFSGFSAFYFKYRGGFNPEILTTIYDIQNKLSNISESRYIQKAKLSYLHGDFRESNDFFEKFKRSYENVNDTDLPGTNFTGLDQSIKETEAAYNMVTARTSIVEVVKSLRTKTESLEKYAKIKKWPTITNILIKTTDKLDTIISKTDIIISTGKLPNLLKSIIGDLTKIKELADGSVLSPSDKRIVADVVESSLPILEEINSTNKTIDALKESLNKLEVNSEPWIKQSFVKLSEKRIELQELGSKVIDYLLIFCAAMVACLILGGVIFKFSKLRQQTHLESEIIELSRKGLLSQDEFSEKRLIEYSPGFTQSFLKLREFAQKRLSFGSIVQESIPFAAALFDSNLKVTWCNTSFYEIFNLNKKTEGDNGLTWDLLLKFTNISHDDPLHLALKSKASGIYQVRIKPFQKEDSMPYELFVMPNDYMGNQKTMVFLYPLKAMEETLNQQLYSITKSIEKMIDSLIQRTTREEDFEILKNDFTVVGMDNLYSGFMEIKELWESEKNELIQELERLESQVFDQIKIIKDADAETIQMNTSISNCSSTFKDVKKNFIQMAYTRSEMEKLAHQLQATLKNLAKECKYTVTDVEKIKNNFSNLTQSFATIAGLKENVKVRRKHIEMPKSELIQIIDSMTIKARTPEGLKLNEESLSGLKKGVKNLETAVSEFTQALTQLELGIVKLEMSFEESDKALHQLSDPLANIPEIPEEFQVARLISAVEIQEGQLIESIKTVVTSVKSISGHKDRIKVLFSDIENEKLAVSGPVFNSENNEMNDSPLNG